MFGYLIWYVIPPLWRIQKELSLTCKGCKKLPFQLIKFDHIEATLRPCLAQKLCIIFICFGWFSGQNLSVNKPHRHNILWAGGHEQTQREEQHNKAYKSYLLHILCFLGSVSVLQKSQTGIVCAHSSKLLLMNLVPLLHVVADVQLLLLLFMSSKEFDLAHDNCTCCTQDIVTLWNH